MLLLKALSSKKRTTGVALCCSSAGPATRSALATQRSGPRLNLFLTSCDRNSRAAGTLGVIMRGSDTPERWSGSRPN